MKKVFITGITGFAGSFLAEQLLKTQKYEVSGTYLTDDSLVNVSGIKDTLKLHKLDLQDYESTKKIIAEDLPDLVFHLAALTAPGESFKNPSEFINNNISAQVNILEAVRVANITPRILIVSTSEVYGDITPESLPINEEAPLRPVSPYAVSKVACDFLGLQYFLSYKLPIIRVRPFNHIGPRQSPAFVVSSFAKKIAEIERGKMEPILKVGNLSAKRDFTDVRDMMEAYIQIVEKGEPGEVYNIGTGRSIEIKEIVEKLKSLSKKEIQIEVDQALLRPIDVPEFVCDNTKIKKQTGWEPKIPIDETLGETLAYWRGIV